MTRISLPVIILNSVFLLCAVQSASAGELSAPEVSRRLVSVLRRAEACIQARNAGQKSSDERRKAAECRYSQLQQERKRLVAEISALKKNIPGAESAGSSKKAAVISPQPGSNPVKKSIPRIKPQSAKKPAPKVSVTAQKPQPLMKSGYNLGRSASLPHLKALKDARKRGSWEKDEKK
jgi:hypothetical protein